MSIICEAIPKTQIGDEVQDMLLSQDEMTRDDWIDVGISLVIAFLLAIVIIAHYPQFNNRSDNILMGKQGVMDNASQNVAILEIPDDTVRPIIKPAEPQDGVKPMVESKGTPIDEATYKLNHTLNGVFVSEEEKVAMVDNRFFNIGDSIDGMKIISIETDKIKLQNIDGMIELRIAV